MIKRIKTWNSTIWGQKKKKMNELVTINSITEYDLFIGASFRYDLPVYDDQKEKNNDNH
ncbi:hypothetical protein [uncultured Eudoraea sp.]|uniref:hypothetical protein n=1 Tax=uncultured Eudoraea sp. TaxID=1035614 RepID=UPI00261848D7|nr:hypothetical protein [uncultured Eudoraea sp.]